MIDLMLDIETLGRGPGCVVPQVAIVPFNINGNPMDEGQQEVFTFEAKLHIGDQLAKGFRLDSDTYDWWMKQDAKVRRDVFSGDVDLEWFKVEFEGYLENILDEFKTYRIWVSAPKLDFGCLHSLLSKPGGEYPILYHAERDLRTLRELVKTLHPEFKLPKGFNPHDAVEDCKRQIVDAQMCYATLKGNNEKQAITTSKGIHGDVRAGSAPITSNTNKRNNRFTNKLISGGVKRIRYGGAKPGFSGNSRRSNRSTICTTRRLSGSWDAGLIRASIR